MLVAIITPTPLTITTVIPRYYLHRQPAQVTILPHGVKPMGYPATSLQKTLK